MNVLKCAFSPRLNPFVTYVKHILSAEHKKHSNRFREFVTTYWMAKPQNYKFEACWSSRVSYELLAIVQLKYGSQVIIPFWCRCSIFLSLFFMSKKQWHPKIVNNKINLWCLALEHSKCKNISITIPKHIKLLWNIIEIFNFYKSWTQEDRASTPERSYFLRSIS